MAETWQNRIVGYGEPNPEQLLANPKNWRVHPKAQREALTSVMDEVGQVAPIIVNRRTGFVVDGHLRVAVALSREQPTIAVAYVDLSEAEEATVLATLDPIGAMAGKDREQYDALLSSLQADDEALAAHVRRIAESAGIIPIPENDPSAIWQGMPEFMNPRNDGEQWQKIIVHFDTREARAAFSALIDQPLTDATQYVYYPRKEKRDKLDLVYDSTEAEVIDGAES